MSKNIATRQLKSLRFSLLCGSFFVLTLWTTQMVLAQGRDPEERPPTPVVKIRRLTPRATRPTQSANRTSGSAASSSKTNPQPPVPAGTTDDRNLTTLGSDQAATAPEPIETVELRIEEALEQGNKARDAGQYGQAEQYYRTALRLNNREARAYLGLGNVYLDQMKFDEAVEAYQQAVQLEPDDASGYFGLGSSYVACNCHDKAIPALQKAIQLKPDDPLVHDLLGDAYLGLHRYDEAIQAYQKAIQLKPDFASPYFNLGIALSVLKRYDEYIRVLQKEIQIWPDRYRAYYNLGIVYLELKNKKAAVEQYKKLQTIDPHWASELLGYIKHPDRLKPSR